MTRFRLGLAWTVGLTAASAGCDPHGTATRAATARADLASLNAALQAYRANFNAVPTTAQGLTALVTAPAGVRHWNGPYAAGPRLTDPWGHAYVYRSPGANGAPFDLLSGGPDGVEGDADDVR